MEASTKLGDALQRLRQTGLRIAIDDFGIGFSSLKYLTVYPISRLKIAQDLVFGVTDDARNAAVVRAAIRLAMNSASRSSPRASKPKRRRPFCHRRMQ